MEVARPAQIGGPTGGAPVAADAGRATAPGVTHPLPPTLKEAKHKHAPPPLSIPRGAGRFYALETPALEQVIGLDGLD